MKAEYLLAPLCFNESLSLATAVEAAWITFYNDVIINAMEFLCCVDNELLIELGTTVASGTTLRTVVHQNFNYH